MNSSSAMRQTPSGASRAQRETDLVRRFLALPADRRRLFLAKLAEQGMDFSALPIPPDVCAAGLWPLSPLQQGLWFLAQLAPDSAAYHIAGGLRLSGALDAQAVRQAFERLAERHEVLRLAIGSDQGQPYQTVRPLSSLPFHELDLSGEADPAGAARALGAEEARRPFPLETGPLWRLHLLRLGEQEHELWLTLHHLIADGWSLDRMLEEFAELYAAMREGRPPSLPLLPVRYGDYAAWRRGWLEAGEAERLSAWWRAWLGGSHPSLDLPADRPRPARPSHRGGRVPFRLDAGLNAAIQRLARARAATPFMVLLAGLYALLYRYTGQTDLRVGVPLAERDRHETRNLLGYFVNTVVFRVELDGRLGLGDLLERVKRSALEAQAHAGLPFESLVEALAPERSLDRNPLFQVSANHQPRDVGVLAPLPGLRVESLERDNGSAQFDLSLDTEEDAEGRIRGVFTYAADLFDTARIERLRTHYLRTLDEITLHPERRLAELELLAADERRQLAEWNRRQRGWPEAPGVAELIRDRAGMQPEAVALRHGAEAMTYAALDAAANRLARRLLRLGLEPEAVVAVVMQPTPRMIAAMLGVFRSGATLLPLDPEQPQCRLAALARDAGTWLAVTESALERRLPAELPRLALDRDDWMRESAAAPAVAIHPAQLAYLIHTSGSTGAPKAVAVSHGALAAHCLAAGERYGIGREDHVLHFAGPGFDAALEQWIVPLLSGACVTVRGRELWSVERARQEIGSRGITCVDLPPAYLAELAAATPEGEAPASLKLCIVGGEALPRAALELIQRRLRPTRLVNAYGPTEAVITPLAWETGPDAPCATPYAPIGAPVGDRSAHILDGDLNPVPVGVAGELYLGGAGLARGYLGRPGLTAERFLPDPFAESGARLYRTGDRARWLTDGTVEYLGRSDRQIKLRGYRIEPGEIEARLLAHPAVTEAVAVVHGEGTAKRLLAYAAAGSGTGADDLKEHLRGFLPEYMVPAHILLLDRLPKLPGGKLDRKALPDPEWSGQDPFRAPRTQVEQDLAAVWREVLGVERIGIDDNFFELGGDSIVSLQVVSRARQAGWAIAPGDLFRHQTVASLARAAQAVAEPAAESGPASGEVGLTPIQAAFFAEDIPRRHHWNQSLLLECRQALDTDALGSALRHLVRQHDSLRLRYRREDGGWVQFYAAAEDCGTALLRKAHAADAEAITAIAQETQRSLNLEQGPLLRAVYLELEGGGCRLLLVIHHLVVDGVSWRILLEDLQTAYGQLRSGQPVRLPAKTASFQAWSRALREYAAGAELARELTYWESLLAAPVPSLPRDFPAAGGRFRDAESLELRLDAASTRALVQGAPTAYRARIEDLLLTALARTLCRWSGQPELLVELESHGREPLGGLDLSRSVGWHTAVHPVRLRPAPDLGDSIKAIKEQLRRVPRGGLGHGLLRYLAPPELRARLEALPVPRVGFNYFGQFREHDGLFFPARESPGSDHDGDTPLPAWLEINGEIHAGELALRWRYSRNMYRPETMQALQEDYRRELLALAGHCQSGVRAATPSDFPLAGLDQARLDALYHGGMEDLYPLSPMQQGLLFHSLYAPEERTYVNQLAVDIDGLDPQRFAAAWREALRRHAILRSAFLWRGAAETPLQAVQAQVELPLEILDWRGRENAGEGLAELRAAEHARGFDLARPPLLRLVLVRLDGERHHLVWTSHHLLLDGWSTSRLLGEVLGLYTPPHPPLSGGAFTPPPDKGGAGEGPAPFRAYIAWLQSRDPAADEHFWRSRLALLDEPTRLADAVATPAPRDKGMRSLRLSLDAAAAGQLRRAAEGLRLTLNTLVQGAWALLLQRYTGQPTVAFGITVAGRPPDLPGVEDMLGLFINTLPLVQTPRSEQPAADWLTALQAENLALREHEQVPLYEIQRWWKRGGEPLFDSLLVFENYPVDQAIRDAAGGLRFGVPAQIDDSHYPMTLSVAFGTGLDLIFGYQAASFDGVCVERLAQHFQNLLRGLAEAPERPLGTLTLLSEEEKAMVRVWNGPRRADPFRLPVHECIRRRAEARPEATALLCGAGTLSYGELERRANRLAHRLMRRGVQPEIPVGIALERSPAMIVAALAVLKAGGAYVPLDTDMPAERLGHLLESAGIGLVLVQGDRGLECPSDLAVCPPTLAVDAEDLAGEPDTAPVVAIHPQQLAYLIHTSGSTGKPKAVAVAHGPLAAHCRAIGERYGMSEDDCSLHFATFGFDVAVEQWLVPLMNGARLLVRGPQLWSAEQAYAMLLEQGVTWLDMPPAYLAEIAHWAKEQGKTLPLRACSVGGEAVPRESLEAIRRLVGDAPVINAYGPTETVITPLAWTAKPGMVCPTAYAPIGSAVGERQAWILDSELQPLPAGVAGELYIGGAGLARGYHRSPALTAECFLPDPWGAPGARMYRTGDRARWLADGTAEYLGRLDHQVKIRGFRIETGEIEAHLLAHPAVAEAAVLARGEGTAKRLAAYVAGDPALCPEALKEHLSRHLPDYMLPALIVVLERLPRLPSGKLDRKALPEPEWRAQHCEPPKTDTERALAELWRELLDLGPIGRTDDFFDLGGHSLAAMRLVGRVKQSLGVDLELRRVFEFPQLAALAQELDRLRAIASADELEEDLAGALAELSEMSPEMLAALLANGHL
jgi:amino acid adenylation domain-containing protein/non-ribosomal peptide synthase protein (TIGR01720 family)